MSYFNKKRTIGGIGNEMFIDVFNTTHVAEFNHDIEVVFTRPVNGRVIKSAGGVASTFNRSLLKMTFLYHFIGINLIHSVK